MGTSNGSLHSKQSFRGDLLFYEEQASKLRIQAGVEELDRLDPFALAKKYNLTVAYPKDLRTLDPEDLAYLTGVDAAAWSGMGIPLPDGRLVVVLHPSQARERAAVTVMEEIAHVHFGHKPTRLVTEAGLMTKREYNGDQEKEAYWTAAATLLPAYAVAKAVWTRSDGASLAKSYGVSIELVEFRIKTMGLWKQYKGLSGTMRSAS